jgi:hypothetical protein
MAFLGLLIVRRAVSLPLGELGFLNHTKLSICLASGLVGHFHSSHLSLIQD